MTTREKIRVVFKFLQRKEKVIDVGNNKYFIEERQTLSYWSED